MQANCLLFSLRSFDKKELFWASGCFPPQGMAKERKPKGKKSMDVQELNARILPPDAEAAQAAQAHWDHIAKPLKGLGQLEEEIVRIAALTGKIDVHLDKRAVLVLCADNGVVAEGVTQTDVSVTAAVARSVVQHHSSVCLMASVAKADVFAVDMGMLERVEGTKDCHIANGTKNLAKKPAMSRSEAVQAIETGIALVKEYQEKGYQILVTGEMGIGNTTTSSAVTALLLSLPVETVTGRGAGLSNAGLARKIAAIKQGIALHQPDPKDPLDVLAKLGGFDLAGMTGLFLGGALYRVPVLIDGLISSVAALIAARLCPASTCAMLASHCSAEPAAQRILQELGLNAPLQAGLKLGEGTGAVCMLPLYDMALAVYHGSADFAAAGIAQYELQEGDMR